MERKGFRIWYPCRKWRGNLYYCTHITVAILPVCLGGQVSLGGAPVEGRGYVETRGTASDLWSSRPSCTCISLIGAFVGVGTLDLVPGWLPSWVHHWHIMSIPKPCHPLSCSFQFLQCQQKVRVPHQKTRAQGSRRETCPHQLPAPPHLLYVISLGGSFQISQAQS